MLDPHEARIGVLTLCKISKGGASIEWALGLDNIEFCAWLDAAADLEKRLAKG